MSNTASTEQKNFTNALISALSNRSEIPDKQLVKKQALKMASLFNYTGNINAVVLDVLAAMETRMDAGTSLIRVDAQHDDRWVEKRDDIGWIYADAYEEFLREGGWSPQMVRSLGDETLRILGHLENPYAEGTNWGRRGLVIGHVQSGKTANYTGLIARAADAGYKFIVVIAGMHNNLRKQTQGRIDAAFIGRSSHPGKQHDIGVGLLRRNYPKPVALTNVNEDFNKHTASKSGWQINDFSKPVVLVIKKNVRTLEALHNWLKNLNTKGDGQIRDVPMLMIDDEADHASINTNKEDLDPTKTNAWVRKILGIFAMSSYVGYTATPFANIFINPQAYDKDVLEDLFPRDFIHSLQAPTTYFGAEKVFLADDSESAFVNPIDDCEDFIPFKHKRDSIIEELPPSLYDAFDEFIVARAIRNLRGQRNKHCSMMVNVSRFVPIQLSVRSLLSVHSERTREAVLANYAMPEKVASKNRHMQRLRNAFDRQYSDAGHAWVEVKAALKGVFDHLHLFVINSKSDEVLDYERYDEDGIGLTAVAVGGLTLSRGLTIEGLTVSYMYRNTKMYDTLMQMGRWFGYRPNYEDLCRVHLSRDSIDWYAHIAEASEEVVQQVRRMRRDGLSPKDFGLYVRRHPDSLLVTARNKMRTGEKVTLEQSLSGCLRESHVLSTDSDVNAGNTALIEEFWRDGFGGVHPSTVEKGIVFRDVATNVIGNFLRRFECHSKLGALKTDVIEYLHRIEQKRPNADVLLVSPKSGNPGGGPFSLNSQIRADNESQIEGTAWRLSKGRVASRGDERIGLDDKQREQAEQIAAPKEPSDAHYREIRNKPLLMLHCLEPRFGNVDAKCAAFGVSFPYGDHTTTVEAVVNRVWLEAQQGYNDDPDLEEDYDE